MKKAEAKQERDIAPQCRGDQSCKCANTRYELDNDTLGKKARITKAKKSATATPNPYPRDIDSGWIVHKDTKQDAWVCSYCGHPIDVHPEGNFSPSGESPRRKRTRSEEASSRSRSNVRTEVKTVYEEKCPLTGASLIECEATHLFPRGKGGIEFKKLFRDINLTEDDIDTTSNVILLYRGFNNNVERFELAFEPVPYKPAFYTAFVGIDSNPLLTPYRGKEVKLAAHSKVLEWHLANAKAMAEATPTTSGGRPSGREGGSKGKEGGASPTSHEKRTHAGSSRSRDAKAKSGGDAHAKQQRAHFHPVDEEQDLSDYAIASKCHLVRPNPNISPFNLVVNGYDFGVVS